MLLNMSISYLLQLTPHIDGELENSNCTAVPEDNRSSLHINKTRLDPILQPLCSHITCTPYRLGAGGSPPGPLELGLELGPSDGAGAGLMGKDMMF